MTEPHERSDLSRPNLLPYGIVPQAPAMVVPDVALFRRDNARSVQTYFDAKFQELQRQYQDLLHEVKVNDIIYGARYSFIPLIGQHYHVYRVSEGDYILSLIEPERWTRYEFVGSYRMSSANVWEPIE
jgi:hypothetical protein